MLSVLFQQKHTNSSGFACVLLENPTKRL